LFNQRLWRNRPASRRKAYDLMVQAASGLMSISAGNNLGAVGRAPDL
jgi:crotonobetainyl-CoA:carnitine CoA-transferase CaiB-like acyl-CoA transferase